VIGNKESIATFLDWTKAWQKGIPKKRAVFLYGPPGIGKTVVVEAAAHDCSMELVEKNASDYRTEDAINHFAGLASQYGSLFGARRIVLLDELDGLTGTSDRGGVKAIAEVVKNAQAPIVLISNLAYDPRFSTLRSYCLAIEFRKPAVSDVSRLLKRISSAEGIKADEAALKFVAQRSDGDVRSAVNDLQALAQAKKDLTYDDVSWLGYRDRHDTIFNVLRMILYGKSCWSAKQAANMADVDVDMLFEWIYENIPEHLSDPNDLARAMNMMSLADVYRGRIRKSLDWSLTRYVIDFMTAGVCMARQKTEVHGWIPFRFPTRIQMLSRSKAERVMKLSIGQKIKRKMHISAVKASKEILPYLRIIFKNSKEMGEGLAKWFDLDQEMADYLCGVTERSSRAKT